MSTKRILLLAAGLYIFITAVLVLVVGSDGKNDEFQPQNEFLLEPWIAIEIGGIDLSFNKAVLYLVLASMATVGVISFIEPDAEAAKQGPDGDGARL